MLKITTNNHKRTLLYQHSVPSTVLADQFDYHEKDEYKYGYFKYQGYWYHLDMFMEYIINNPWSLCLSESFTTGIVARHIENEYGNSCVIVGSYKITSQS